MESKVTIRLAEGHPAQYVPGFGSCAGGGTLEVSEKAAADLCCAPHWSRVGSSSAAPAKAPSAKKPTTGGKE